ncbi:major facilitator superfamily domain-containing protein [Suillus clintonianus]|uniref:major facilitator superfamily domain-containing protein n=1 Tax=Suillus clintonianus TaxID=1904413 RepID=UPI001B871E50|nr:major facilitator superfamily domain-containing protein [Suillus clintonianus]KAG2152742.1 major facilitator superfamily domain-containing protein [Suillus clintonianus]
MLQLEERSDNCDVEVAEKFDPTSYYEQAAGRLVIDPQQAKVEFGEALASTLKLSRDGSTILWPQPADDPNDPQNWSDRHKALHLLVITLAASIPDFDSGIGIASIFGLAQTYNTTTGVINNLTSNWSIFLLGWGGIFWVMLMRRYGRLPVLFWTQVFAVAFLVGATFSPDLATFTAMRCLTAFFGTCPQVTGLYVVTDIFPFHLQARKLNIWTFGFIISPFLSPFAFGFLVARMSWRWAYGIGSIYSAIVVLLIGLFMEETMYDRHLDPHRERILPGIQYRLKTLIGITGYKMARYRSCWSEVVWACLNVVWRPQFILVAFFEAFVFGFSVGVNVTNVVFMGSPPPVGFGFSEFGVAGAYATPIVAVILGEVCGRFLNDRIMDFTVRKNNGIFEAESRLWACYAAMPLYICGFLTLGAGIQHLNKAALILGWGIAEVAVMVNTVAVYAYCNDCFPRRQGEISALLNLARVLGGFSVAYFQVPWATKSGGIETYGVEAAIVMGLFLLAVPTVQLRGRYFREHFAL